MSAGVPEVAEVTDATFDEVVLDAPGPVVVDYWAQWCGPCRMMSPIIAELAAEHPDVTFVALDTMANPATAARFGILALPTFQLFRGGELVHQLAGARPKHKFWAEIDRALA